jgi:hypothetical protein
MSALYQRDAASIPDRGPALVFLMWALTFISFVTVVLRFIFRARKNQIGWDDIFMGTTWVCESRTEVSLH